MTEKTISEKLREAYPRVKLGGKAYSFESAAVWSVPDLYFVAPGAVPFWIELKVVDTESDKIPFRTGQPAWIEDHSRAGGLARVLVYVKDERSFILLDGEKARTLSKLRVREAFLKYYLNYVLEFSGDRESWETVVRSLYQLPSLRAGLISE